MRRELLVILLLGACKSEQEELVEQLARQPRGHVPPMAVGAGTEANGLPLGYPERLPLVPGGEAVGGGVDPGVIRTATIRYPHLGVTAYVTALEAALRERGQRIVTSFETASGSRQMRIDVGEGYANLVVAPETPEGGSVRVDVTMMEPRTP